MVLLPAETPGSRRNPRVKDCEQANGTKNEGEPSQNENPMPALTNTSVPKFTLASLGPSEWL
jgi:hypothetical protein